MVLPWHSSPTSSPKSRTLPTTMWSHGPRVGSGCDWGAGPSVKAASGGWDSDPSCLRRIRGFAECSEGVHTLVELLSKISLRKEGMSAGITEKIGRGGRTNSQKVVLGNSDWSSPVQPSPSLPVANPCEGLRKTSATLPSRRRVGTMVMGCTG